MSIIFVGHGSSWKCTKSHSQVPSWDRNIVPLTPNSQGRLSKWSEKCLEPAWTSGHHPKYRVVGCVLKGAMGWGQSARDTKRGALSDCSHFRCQISDPMVLQLFIECLWKHNGRQGWLRFSVSDIPSFLYRAAGVMLQIERSSYMKRNWHIEPGSLFLCRKLWSSG